MTQFGTPSQQVVVAHLGARLHYAVAALLQREGYLLQLYTDLYSGQGSWLHYFTQLIPQGLKCGTLKRLSQRTADLPAAKVTAYNFLGLQYDFALRRGPAPEVYLQFNQLFGRKVIRSRQYEQATVVYGFTGSSLELFQQAQKTGAACVVEQMLAPVRTVAAVNREEVERWPSWQVRTDAVWDEEVWCARELTEWQLAQKIIAPSDYVRTTLIEAGAPSDRICVMPYAVSADHFCGRLHEYDGTRPLRVLFVGVLSLRKGIPYLLEALKKLGPKQVMAKLLGPVDVNQEMINGYRDVAQVVGQVSRAEVADYYDWADVLVMPSLCEGSATVAYEARASGLPVLATFSSGTWLQDRVDGLSIPMRDSAGLADCLMELIAKPEMIQTMSRAALTNALNYTWIAYQQRLRSLVDAL
jgi:glycosyltransferase involved in cell wall biosynthesis